MRYIILLMGLNQPLFAMDFRNALGCPGMTSQTHQAKSFPDREAANEWAKKYLSGYNWTVILDTKSTKTLTKQGV